MLTRRAVGLRRGSDSEDDSKRPKAAAAAAAGVLEDELGLERSFALKP